MGGLCLWTGERGPWPGLVVWAISGSVGDEWQQSASIRSWGPFANLWLTYSNALDGLAKGCEPAALGLGRYNLELMTLALRRTQAWH